MRCCGWSWNCSGRNLHSRHRKLQLRLRLLLGLVSFLAELKLVLTVISLSLCCWFCKCLEWIADMPTYNILNYDNQRCLMFFPLCLGYILRWSRSVAHCTRVSVCVCLDHWSWGCHPVRCSNWHSLLRETFWNVVLCLKWFPDSLAQGSLS